MTSPGHSDDSRATTIQRSSIPPRYRYDRSESSDLLVLTGDWLSGNLDRLPERLWQDVPGGTDPIRLDVAGLAHIDTAGALAVRGAIGAEREIEVAGGVSPELERLIDLIGPVLSTPAAPAPRPSRLGAPFVAIGRTVVDGVTEIVQAQTFAGQLAVTMARLTVRPRRIRLTPLVAVMQQSGLSAVPIVMVMTFFIGAVLALVGSTMLQTLGVTIYAVELVGIGVLREFGPVIAAILFAGRSASAFAAQIGSMRMNQEIDAMTVLGIDIMEALVVPRVVAALIMLPLLTVVGDIGGMVGGMLVSSTLLGIEPTLFAQRMVDSVGVGQFWVGMAKTPLLALVIAMTGCRQGLAVEGDNESLGRRVTDAVVRSIFLIIMFDALFAVLFYQVGA